ncbi:MAG TPA: hypothetical protein DEQ49_01420, partial [Arthrobacter bacterium]|nr:hypothetical protein [Arthrobacter sp.]
MHADVEVTAEQDRLAGLGHTVHEHGCAQQFGIGHPLVRKPRRVQVADDERLVSALNAHRVTNTPLLAPGKTLDGSQSQPPCLGAPETERVEDHVPMLSDLEVRAEQDRIRLSGERRAQEPVVNLRENAADLGCRGERADTRALR